MFHRSHQYCTTRQTVWDRERLSRPRPAPFGHRGCSTSWETGTTNTYRANSRRTLARNRRGCVKSARGKSRTLRALSSTEAYLVLRARGARLGEFDVDRAAADLREARAPLSTLQLHGRGALESCLGAGVVGVECRTRTVPQPGPSPSTPWRPRRFPRTRRSQTPGSDRSRGRRRCWRP